MKWFEIFKSGKHTSSNGITKDYTIDDCQKIVDNYNTNIANHEAPMVIGHPKDNDPAYGWIEKLKLVGDTVLAYPKQVVKEFEEAVQQGLYKKRSVSLYPDLTLRHVGFLGAVPPAVKGLADLKFNDASTPESFEFTEDNDQEKIKLINQIIDLSEVVVTKEKEVATLKSYEGDNAKLKTDLEFAQKSKADAERDSAALSVKMRKMEFESYLNDKLAYGSITPAQGEKITFLLEALDSIQLKEGENKSMIFEFSDGKKANPIQLMKDFVELLPVQVKDPTKKINKENRKDEQDFSDELETANRIAGISK